jgi:hypothetical protein
MSMRGPPIPQRIAPLIWRRPSLLWTPLALALAIGWPSALFYNDPGLQRLTLVAGSAVFALALLTLGGSWLIGRAPRTRRIVVVHVVMAGAIAAIAAPFVLTELLAAVADYQHAGAGQNFTFAMSLAMAPLALVLGLPIALISGVLFAWTALTRPHQRKPDDDDLLGDRVFIRDVQPFR